MTLALALALLAEPNPPPALLRMQEQRNRIATAVVEYLREDHYRGGRMYFTCQIANDDLISVQRGDDDGRVFRSRPGQVSELNFRPHRVLRTGEQLWRYDDESVSAEVHPLSAGGNPPDLRSLGLVVGFRSAGVADVLSPDAVRGSLPLSYEQETRDGIHAVTARRGDHVTTWWIDPARGWNPLRVTFEIAGKTVAESRTHLMCVDDVWFPESVAFFSERIADQPCETVHVLTAEFNKPHHPVRLTPEDIGVEFGTNVTRFKADYVPEDLYTWDGRRLIDAFECLERVRSGELRYSARMRALFARLPSQPGARPSDPAELPPPPVPPPPTPETRFARLLLTPWEQFTQRFIERYTLNGEQSQKAWLICDECQKAARKWIDAHRQELAHLIDGAAAVQESTAVTKKSDAALLRPIEDIFANELKPRLERLPTRAQRAAAEKRRPTNSQPASAPGR